MKKRILMILGILVFMMFMVNVHAEQKVAITHATEGDEETLLEYNDNMYKLHDGVTYNLYYQLHDRESGYCFYVTTNNGNIYHNYIDCTEQISPGYFDGTFNSSNLDNHEYTFGYVEESSVTNCTKSANYDEEYDRTYTLDGCGDLNIVNTTNVTVENPYNRQNEISIKNVQVEDKYFNYNNEGEATVTFEGNYYATPLVKGKDYITKVYFSQSDVGNNINANVNVTLIGDAQNRYRLNGSFADSTGNILPYVIKKDDITVDGNNISINVNGIYLTEGEDYTLTYDQTTYQDKTIVEVRGLNNFSSDVVTLELKQINEEAYVQELIDEILTDEIIINTKADNYNTINSVNYKYVVNNVLEERIQKDNEHNYFNIKSCGKSNCVIDIVRYDEDTDRYYRKEDVNVPIKVVGFVIDDVINASVNDKISINYKFVDENGQEKNVILKRITPDFEFEDKVKIENDKVQVLEKGIIPVYLDLEYENERYEKKVYILVDFDSLINEKVNKSSFNANKSKYEYFDSLMYIAEYTFVDELLDGTYIDYTIDSHSVCNSDVCDKDAVVDFDFTFYIGDKSFTIKKDDVIVLPIGIVFNHDYNETIDLEVGQTQKVDYTLYSKKAIWSSTDPSVATVDNEGNVTSVGEGATLVIAMVENGLYESIIVRTKPTEGTIKNILNNELNNIFGDNKTFDAKMVSSINDDYKIDYLSTLIYDYIYERKSSDNIVPSIEIDLDSKTANISLGYIYMKLQTPEDYYRSVSYCKAEIDDEEGFDCKNNSLKLTIVYEDEKDNFDNSLLEKAQSLLNKIDFEKEHYSYINDSLEEYMENIADYGMHSKIESKYSDYNQTIKNEDGFIFVIDDRFGDFAYGGGFGYIEKDGVIYVSTEDSVSITQVIGVKENPKALSEKINAIKDVIRSKVDESKYKIEVTRIDEEGYEDKDIYQIRVIDKNDEEKELYLFAKLVTNYEDNNTDEPAIDSVVIENINIKGIVKPKENEKVNLNNLEITTEGVRIKKSNWYKDDANWQKEGPVTTFAGNQKYMLIIELDVMDGYKLSDEFNEEHVTVNADALKVEYVRNSNDIRLYYESQSLPRVTETPTIKATKSNDNSILVSWNNVENATSYEVYRSTKNNSGFSKVATTSENSYLNTGLTYGTTYYYKVKALNNISNKTSGVVSGKVLPNTVENLRVDSIGSTNIKIAYDKVNVTGYEVYFGTKTSSMKNVATITKNGTLSYNKTGLKTNTTYYFKVRAYKTVGKKKIYGSFSEILPVITGPTAPKLTVSNVDYKTLNIKINSVSGATNYKLEVSTDNKNYSLLEIFESADTYTHTDLTEGSTYYYRVKAYNSDGSPSSYSSVVSKKVVPNAPVITVKRVNDNKVVVTTNIQEGVDGYHIYRSTNKTKNYKKVGSTNTEEYTDSLTYGTTYYYKVVAYNSKSTSSYSNIVSIKVVPEKVENLTSSSVGTNNIKISYDKVNVTGYEVYYGTKTNKMSKATTITKSDTLSYNKTKLKANTTYYFKVRAYKTVGKKKIYGPYSNILTVKTSPSTPKVSLSIKKYNEMNITIGNVSGASKYVVEKSLDGSEYSLVEELPKSGLLTQSELEVGNTYYFRVKSCNIDNNCSSWATVKKVQTTASPTFTLSTSSKKVTVKLNNVENADGYEIYRSTYKNKKYSKIKTFTNEDELLEYVNSTSKGKTYYYKVRSYKVVGDTTIYSDYSSVKSVKSK